MATINQVGTSLSGQTGTGSFAGSTSPSFTTPNIGAATATTVAFSPTTNGIVGTTTNNSAAAGIVGQVISNGVNAPGTALTSTMPLDLISLSLTAGDWDVYGNVSFSTSTATQVACWASLTSATLPDLSLYSQLTNTAPMGNPGMTIPYLRVLLSGSATLYLSASATFATSTCSVSGNIKARRRR